MDQWYGTTIITLLRLLKPTVFRIKTIQGPEKDYWTYESEKDYWLRDRWWCYKAEDEDKVSCEEWEAKVQWVMGSRKLENMRHFLLFLLFFLIGVKLIYNVVLVSGVQHSDSVVRIYICNMYIIYIYYSLDFFPLEAIMKYWV